MTREDFENGLIARLEDIRAFYKQYNPKAFEEGNKPYLSMAIYGDFIHAFNRSYKKEDNNPDNEFAVDCWKRDNSQIVHNNR